MEKFLVIRRKTFAIVQQFEAPCNKSKKFAGKPLQLEANPRKPQTFSTANDLHYTVLLALVAFNCTLLIFGWLLSLSWLCICASCHWMFSHTYGALSVGWLDADVSRSTVAFFAPPSFTLHYTGIDFSLSLFHNALMPHVVWFSPAQNCV